MHKTLSLALAGAGLIGRRHAEAIMTLGDAARLHAIVDPAGEAKDYAAGLGVAWYPDLNAMFSAGAPDGVIIATPNHLHVENGLECISRNIPILVEKPIASSVGEARRLVEAANEREVPLLVGHHRRHNPLIAAAKDALDTGAVGTIVTVHAMFWLYKPDDYFSAGWRNRPGAGPVFINLIHDIDVLRHLCGEIACVEAMQSASTRKHANEDTAVIILRFESGALGTVNMSDTVAAPWSWELTSKENPAYPPTDEFCYLIGGTAGSLELPGLSLWSYPDGKRDWLRTLASSRIAFRPEDPLVRQIRHFCSVIRGRDKPLVSGREGLRTLEVIEAIKRSAETVKAVFLTGPRAE